MDIYEAWEKALKKTEIIRSRVQGLKSFQDTLVPYVMLCESSINVGDTVVRKGEVVIQKPSLVLPPNIPMFKGFEFEEDFEQKEGDLVNFLIVRGVSLPSMKYNNTRSTLDLFEGKLSNAIKHYSNLLAREENVSTGLVVGPEDCWQFSLLILICAQIAKNAETDIKKLLDEYHRKKDQ